MADDRSTRPAGAAAELPTDPAALERLIAERRDRLAATVDELARRARPRELARRGAADLNARVRAATRTEDGSLRVERVAAVAAALIAVVAVLIWRGRRKR